MTKNEVYESINKLRSLLLEKDRDIECYNVYVSLIVEMCDMSR